MNKQISIAYQGRPGAWSEMAARQLMAHRITALPCQSFEMVITIVLDGTADFGLLPTHNSTIGRIEKSCQLLAAARIKRQAETTLRISHALLGLPGTPLSAVRQVYSHPAALAQCTAFFRQHTALEPIATDDTAGAVEWIMQQHDPGLAAIAGQHTGRRYGASVIARALENTPDNCTRFTLFSATTHRGACAVAPEWASVIP